MKDSRTIQTVTELATPLAEALGLVLWGVEFAGGAGRKSVLRIYVDAASLPNGPEPDAPATESVAPITDMRETGMGATNVDGAAVPAQAGVSIDQCARLSRDLGLALDVEDAVPGSYTLEVSSPGFERRFFRVAQLAAYVGHEVRVELHEPLDAPFPGRKNLVGALDAVDGATLRLTVDGEPVQADFAAAKRVSLVHRFQDSSARGKGPAKKKK
ncbi:MAG: ribosome maturation factor RimP [Desulfovibrionaceae bacterium]|jgi:ribosome maturation factor RimP|nr:ribosome maturation factor RimP [Desulfovibrionaceae bacterium]